ncbi:MAG TPA: hypothetical protein VNN18_07000 [Candidatus Xenobia bacterium]|nr:hypothetical protein [Candidatus Xenobia bacterium]
MVIVAAGAVWAGEVWNEKAASAWTADEALEIVTDSPWAKSKAVMSGRHAVRAGSPQPRPARSSRDRGPTSQAPAPPSGQDWALGPDDIPVETYLVRWESAKPVAEAFARLRELGLETSAEFQSPPPLLPGNRYVITVKTLEPPHSGKDLLEGLEPAELIQRARLKTRRGEVPPVEVGRSGVGANAAVHFLFPRERDGQPLLRGPSEVVEFVFKAPRQTLKQKFRVEREWVR